MQVIPKSVQNLIDELSKLPGVGPKTAGRLAFYLLKESKDNVRLLGEAVLRITEGINSCSSCCSLTDSDSCQICDDLRRDQNLICVVEEPLDILAIENTGQFRGQYHVLNGVISPIEGMGPEDLTIGHLMKRLDRGVVEVIIATNPNLEGEATALYLQKLILPLGIRVTRLASGLPMGADLEYADQLTVSRALEGRVEV
ncbi:TPA: recombination protein RecR [candidate division CPR2 bacterium]|uniref:Recombination protein RecR n=1 Tax=candidate division CPR2 bacterium GW2011_GWC1_41_48 TaxID=1618344 RepID=A0A0G0YK21_UNCC2|nr:MAG: Recombination protein RecR [candidate division CPR2 bacterium GW2011_GWC2_39_35]KKR28858.1 MAG: Recombination protein RecR [candidate division CPR2 bacterium GW2011_GWD2_39_7]KKR29390.1 MAG: Recombination protein RecR [candidate division CPR2 bacterium GW2011_GWD1_39_7]KKS09901.1 MAG: RecR [candidate division CPR2 bacterium GW2011_GWC1_41_48]OGB62270.1 MAG: recombination protein RecR [candidate division CPR2 bacterium GWD1_39_7]OGB73199.1 MAG: recombination protein RecR [candidate divi